MSLLWTSREMEHLTPDQQAKKAISYMLGRIHDNPSLGYLCGLGTQTFALLTEAAATLFGQPVEEVRRGFAPTAAQDPKAPQWIPVDASLPESDCTVLIACSQEVEPVWLGYHDGESWLSVEGGLPIHVTHWMHLPTPPASTPHQSH